jgi:hypothetical protein
VSSPIPIHPARDRNATLTAFPSISPLVVSSSTCIHRPCRAALVSPPLDWVEQLDLPSGVGHHHSRRGRPVRIRKPGSTLCSRRGRGRSVYPSPLSIHHFLTASDASHPPLRLQSPEVASSLPRQTRTTPPPLPSTTEPAVSLSEDSSSSSTLSSRLPTSTRPTRPTTSTAESTTTEATTRLVTLTPRTSTLPRPFEREESRAEMLPSPDSTPRTPVGLLFCLWRSRLT